VIEFGCTSKHVGHVCNLFGHPFIERFVKGVVPPKQSTHIGASPADTLEWLVSIPGINSSLVFG